MTTVVILTWVAALLDIIGGAALWGLSSNGDLADAMGSTENELRIIGLTSVTVGLLVALVATMLASGSRFARVLVSILMVVRLVGAVATAVLLGASGALEAAVAAVLAVVVLSLLWNRNAQAYFSAA